MTMLIRAAIRLSALLACALAAPVLAQTGAGFPIAAPAGFIPLSAMGYDDGTGRAQTISVAHGLPVTLAGGLTCTVVSGDQTYIVGAQGALTCTPSGRLKVGLSSSTNIDPAVIAATTLHSDLVGCKARLAAIAWADGYTGALTCNGAGQLVVADPANASFTFAPAGGASESSTAAAYTFSTANSGVARGWYSNCPASTTVLVTLTGVNGGTKAVTLYDGPYGPVGERITAFAGNNAGCTIGLEF